MSKRIYKYYWQAKIVAWIKGEMVFSVLVDDGKLYGYITAKFNKEGWKCWYGSCK